MSSRKVSDIVIDFLERLYPRYPRPPTSRSIDEATPLSYEHYTGNWLGPSFRLAAGPQADLPIMIKGMPKTLPGLDNFYMAGQWVEPGGTVSVAAASGRNVIQMISVADGKPFKASTT